MRFGTIIFSILLSFSASAESLDSLRTERRPEGLFVVHQVEEKETLYSLSTRYKCLVQTIIDYNKIEGNKIDIGQVLFIQISEQSAPITTNDNLQVHVVQAGETLYGISKKYEVKIKDLKRWNNLEGNNLSLGMSLKLSDQESESIAVENPEAKTEVADQSMVNQSSEVNSSKSTFEKYLVQTGETLSTIAAKLSLSIDSLKSWNQLTGDYLRIGQNLLYKEGDSLQNTALISTGKTNRSIIDENGFEKIFEEGIASVIPSMNTSKYLALHRSLPIGANLEVRNLMNNRVVHVKVVGKLPDIGVNENILLRISEPAYDQLGILDSKSRVEVSYYKQ